MLISLEHLIIKYDINLKGILHECEEIYSYDKILWVEASRIM